MELDILFIHPRQIPHKKYIQYFSRIVHNYLIDTLFAKCVLQYDAY